MAGPAPSGILIQFIKRHGIKLLESSTYEPLAQNYMNVVLDRMKPIAMPNETQQ
jgi:hypothetical protein